MNISIPSSSGSGGSFEGELKRDSPNDLLTPQIKRKRNIRIRSCMFCRGKKLKCDKLKPRCSSCALRHLTECVYIDSTNPSPSPSALDQSTPEIRHYDAYIDPDELEKTYNLTGYEAASYNSQIHEENPLSKAYFIWTKGSGRTITHGPTSLSTLGRKGITMMMDRGGAILTTWLTMKKVRRKWKEQYDFSTLKELKSLEHISNEKSSLVEEVCKSLPSYNELLYSVNAFFDNPELYPYSSAFHKGKVINDFYKSFIPDISSDIGMDVKIKEIRVTSKKNYCKIAVIIMILAVTAYHSELPEPIERFLIALNGSSMAKIFYVERSQFLLLRIIHRKLYISDSDDSSALVDLRSSLCSNAIMIGLNRNMSLHYSHHHFLIGSTESLENLWIWTLLLDFQGALEIGSPMFITSEAFNEFDGSLDDTSSSFMGKLKRYLKVARPMLRRIFLPSLKPDLSKDEQVLLKFIEIEFPSIDNFIDQKKFENIGSSDIMILASALSFLMANLAMRIIFMKDNTLHVKTYFTKISLLTYNLSVNSLLSCFEKDKKAFPELCTENSTLLSPYIALSISFTSHALRRALVSTIILTHYKLTTLSDVTTFLNQGKLELELNTDSLRTEEDSDFSLISAFEKHCQIFDKWATPQNPLLHKILNNSYYWVNCTTIERMSRRFLSKFINHRQEAENTWISKNMEAIVSAFDDNKIPSNADIDKLTSQCTTQLNASSINLQTSPTPPVSQTELSTLTSHGNNSQLESERYTTPEASNNDENMSHTFDDFWKTYLASSDDFLNED